MYKRQLVALFFMSGASGLIYQVLWVRMLSLTFGITVYAAVSYTHLTLPTSDLV